MLRNWAKRSVASAESSASSTVSVSEHNILTYVYLTQQPWSPGKLTANVGLTISLQVEFSAEKSISLKARELLSVPRLSTSHCVLAEPEKTLT